MIAAVAGSRCRIIRAKEKDGIEGACAKKEMLYRFNAFGGISPFTSLP
jgi:hypothetical protein